jgi:phosphate transport system ATP-binding protein
LADVEAPAPAPRSAEAAQPSAARALLRVEELRVAAGDREILKGISLEAGRGEILSVIGPAGAGKTTFLRAINRMNDLDAQVSVSGQVYLDGRPVYHPSVDVALLRRRVGFVFSVPIVLPMSVYENVTFGIRLDGTARSTFAERAEEALRAAYLWEEVKERLGEPARNLSGGQQQRLCLARALVLRPDVLLLDEPCSGLDPISTARIEDALQGLKQDVAVVLVTNNVKQASRASDRTAFFLFGELIELRPTEDLFTTPRDQRTADYVSGRFG